MAEVILTEEQAQELGETQKITMNSWKTYGSPLVSAEQLDIEFMTPFNIAVREILQNGAVQEGGQDCLVKVYRGREGEMRLMVANSADKPANTSAMLNLNDSKSESISNLNGIGLKAALSYLYDEDNGHFEVATRSDNNIVIRRSPYADKMPVFFDNDISAWKTDMKYRTYVDTELKDYDRIKERGEITSEKLAQNMGILFGKRIKDHRLNLRIEAPDGIVEKVAPVLPEMLEGKREFYGRKSDPETDTPELVVNHHQKTVIEKDGKTIDVEIQSAETQPGDDSPFTPRQKTQGAYLLQDGVIQAYCGMKLFGIAKHPSMNGKFVFINMESKDGATLKFGNENPFDPSKTALVENSKLAKTLKGFFEKSEKGRDGDERGEYAKVNSIRAWFVRTRQSEWEKEYRQFEDRIKKLAALFKRDEKGNLSYRYVKEYSTGRKRFDGAVLKTIDGATRDWLIEHGKYEDYVNGKPIKEITEVVEEIIEYKKATITQSDVNQFLDYVALTIRSGKTVGGKDGGRQGVPAHCILYGPTIEKDALEHLLLRITENPNFYQTVCLKLTNDEWDIMEGAERSEYTEKQKEAIIGPYEFETIKRSGRSWTKQMVSQYPPEIRDQLDDPERNDYFYGSAPLIHIPLMKKRLLEISDEYNLIQLPKFYREFEQLQRDGEAMNKDQMKAFKKEMKEAEKDGKKKEAKMLEAIEKAKEESKKNKKLQRGLGNLTGRRSKGSSSKDGDETRD